MYIMNKSCCKKQQNFLTSKLIIKHINKMIKSLMLINAYYCLILKYHRFNGNQVILTRNPNKWVGNRERKFLFSKSKSGHYKM